MFDSQLGGVSTIPHNNVGRYREVPLDDIQKEPLLRGYGQGFDKHPRAKMISR
jgi:hypothetical protein